MTTTTFDTAVKNESACDNCARPSTKSAPDADKVAWAFFVITIVCCGGFIAGIIAHIF